MENVSGIELIYVSTDDATTDTLALNDAFFASNGDSIIVVDTATDAGLTFSAATVTNADYSVDVRSANADNTADSFTGGPGDDTFVFKSTNDANVLDSGQDIVAGGTGSDTLKITTLTIAAAITATTTVTSVENFMFYGVGSTTSAYTLADASVVTSALQANTGTIDYNNGSIDVTSGNITDTNVTLHTHTHNVEDADPAGDNTAGPDVESDSPTSGT